MAAMLKGSLFIILFLSVSVNGAIAQAPKEKEAAPGKKSAKAAGQVDPAPKDAPKGAGAPSGSGAAGDAPKAEPGKDAPAPEGGQAAPQGDEPKPAPGLPNPKDNPAGQPIPKGANPKDAKPPKEPKPKAASVPAPRPKPPVPVMKTPQATEKLQEGLKKFEAEDFVSARTAFTACLKDAATPADKKVIQALIEDTKLGSEIDAARKMVERKEERKAITKVEKALKANPTTYLRPEAEKFIKETEELIFLVLDDFEPGDSLQKETDARDGSVEEKETKASAGNRWRLNQSYNSDPRFVKHGKGAMKWKVGGAYSYAGSGYSYYYDSYSYRSAELKNPITKWRTLVFWVYLTEADEGSLRVSLSPTSEAGVYASLYAQKLTDLRGQKGWKEVRLDINRDFGNTRNVKLEDIHYVRIEYIHVKSRTIYLDYVHFE